MMKNRKDRLEELEEFDVHAKLDKRLQLVGWIILLLTVFSLVILAIVSGMISYNEAVESGISGIPLTLEYGLILFITTLISLTVIFILSSVFFWKPMKEHLKIRKENIETNIDAASYTRKVAEAEYSKAASKNKAAKDEAKQLMSQTKELANKERREILDRAKAEQDQLIERARTQIEKEKEQLKDEIRQEIISTSMVAAEKILEKELDANSNEKMVEELLNSIK